MSRTTTDMLEILDDLFVHDLEDRQRIAGEKVKLEVAQMIYDARMAAGLTQQELAALTGTQPSTIDDLEEADYEGDSLTMLRRIAQALHLRLEIRFVPEHEAA